MRILLLGRPEITGLSKDIVFPSKGFQLLALLASAPSQRLPRREIAGYLWDSVQDDKALQNLRQLIVRMKKALPELAEGLIDGATGLALSNGVYIDLVEFTTGMQANSSQGWLEALRLHRNDLLASIDSVSQTFSHWLLQERAKLRDQYFSAASHVLMHLTRYGNASKLELQAIADAMITLEPERESSYRAVIEAFGRNGMFEEAEQVYRNLLQMLKKEFNVIPSRDTMSIISRVFSSSSSLQDKAKKSDDHNWPRLAILFPVGAGLPLDVACALLTDVANELSKYRTFIVLAPHSSFRISHDTGMPLDNSRLRADYSISGTLSPFKSKQGLGIRLVDCHQGHIVWASEVSLEESQLYSSFHNLSHWIAQTLAANIEKRIESTGARFRSDSAYSAYLGGLSGLASNDLRTVRRARKNFLHALELDSINSAARSKLSQTYYLEWLLRGIDIPELLNSAKSEAETAIQVDPTYSHGHCMRGTVALHQREFDGALHHFQTAEELSPNSADTLIQHADALAHCGEPDTAWKKFEHAIDINPNPPDSYWWAGASIAFDRQDYQKVIKLCGELSDDEAVLSLLAATHALMGEKDLAGTYYARHLEQTGIDPASAGSWQNPDRPGSAASDANSRFIEGLRQAEEQRRIPNGRQIK